MFFVGFDQVENLSDFAGCLQRKTLFRIVILSQTKMASWLLNRQLTMQSFEPTPVKLADTKLVVTWRHGIFQDVPVPVSTKSLGFA